MTENINTILLVDDEPVYLDAVKRILNYEGYEVITSTSPTEVLNIVEKNVIPLMIVEQKMPVMLGDELCAKVAEISPKTIRFLVSEFADFEKIASALTNGVVNRFFQKPIDHLTFMESISEAFNHYNLLYRTVDNDSNHFNIDFVTMLPNRSAFEDVLYQVRKHSDENISLYSMALELKDKDDLVHRYGKVGLDGLLMQAVYKVKALLPEGYFISSPYYGCLMLCTVKHKENLPAQRELFERAHEVVNSPYEINGVSVNLCFHNKIFYSQKEFGHLI